MRLISLVILGLSLSGCSPINQFFKLEDDNVIEEILEDVLKHETGIDIDFTPNTPEVK